VPPLKNQKTKNFSIHQYLNFNGPVMSDSGGFQVFSLGFGRIHGIGKIAREKNLGKTQKTEIDKKNPLKITEEGVEFFFNEKKFFLSPEISIELQKNIGADIIFAFDECTSPLNSYAYTKEAMERTHRWLERCVAKWKENKNQQGLFGIIQGGYFKDLREKSAKFVAKFPLSGFGIGGAFGPADESGWQILEKVIPFIPEEKPRHLLGIGKIRDIFEGIEKGIDTFDCTIPTREARHRILYTKEGKIDVRKMKNVKKAVDKNCACPMCKEKITLEKLNDLFSKKDPLAYSLATLHNIYFFLNLMDSIRKAIENNSFKNLKKKILKYY
jgi:queuine tRNA-ribosyltransferase/7-cyano-7-deazaguanine tRNA-ribosyltransferase